MISNQKLKQNFADFHRSRENLEIKSPIQKNHIYSPSPIRQSKKDEIKINLDLNKQMSLDKDRHKLDHLTRKNSHSAFKPIK